MALEVLKAANRVIGIKQVTKAVNKSLALQVFIAADADERVVIPLKRLCAEKDVETLETATMQELGRACQIEVGAAAVAVLSPLVK